MPKLQLKYSLFVWPNILLLLLVLASCGSMPPKGESVVTVITPPVTPAVPTTAAVRACNQAICMGPSPAPGIRKYIDTFNNIHTVQIFTYNMANTNDAAQYAKNYDFVWGADPNTVADLRAGNPNMFLSYYMTLNRDTGTFLNQQATHPLSYWQALHPDWILYKCDRTTPAYEIGDNTVVPFEMTNNDFINWQVQTYAVPASEAGYDAIAADNLNLDNAFGACGYYQNGKWVQRYTGQDNDPQWEKDMLYWVTQMQAKLHVLPHPLALIPNLGVFSGASTVNYASDQTLQQIIAHVDGFLDESSFTKYGVGYVSGSDWVNLVQLIQEVQQKNKPYYLLNEFKEQPVSQFDSEWAISSYLMAKGHLSALFYSGQQQYGDYINHPEYNAPIGMPTSDMFQDQGVYWRLYSNGAVLVNASASQSATVNLHTINVDATAYTDLYGKVAGQSVNMPAHSGLVLLKKK